MVFSIYESDLVLWDIPIIETDTYTSTIIYLDEVGNHYRHIIVLLPFLSSFSLFNTLAAWVHINAAKKILKI